VVSITHFKIKFGPATVIGILVKKEKFYRYLFTWKDRIEIDVRCFYVSFDAEHVTLHKRGYFLHQTILSNSRERFVTPP